MSNSSYLYDFFLSQDVTMFLNLVDEEEARMNQIFYVGNEMAVKRTDDQWPGRGSDTGKV